MSTSVLASPNQNSTADLPGADRSAVEIPSDPSLAMRRDRIVRRCVTWLATLLIVVVLILILRVQGQVSGVEFSPTHFQQRSFSFYEIPLLHLQITPIRRSAVTSGTANYLRINSLITPGAGPPTLWHVVSITRGLSGTTLGDAQLLTHPLNLDVNGEHWRQWSSDHPQHAKILWPRLQELALRELYVLIPPLLEIAQLEQEPDELRSRLDARLSQQYSELVSDLRASENDELAAEILAEAIQSFPQDRVLQALRLPNSD